MTGAAKAPWHRVPQTIASKNDAKDVADAIRRRFGINDVYRAWELKCVLADAERIEFIGKISYVSFRDTDGKLARYGFVGKSRAGLFVVSNTRLILIGSYGWVSFDLSDLTAPSTLQRGSFGFDTVEGWHIEVTSSLYLLKRDAARDLRAQLTKRVPDGDGPQL